ncbi:MAG: tetratricopeptide repeat protein [Pirellulales bacterium]|jgi:Flp pilus assembly protein TadD|nr:tetratricopeptide repeat protein [Pirellulales bacterium]|tara:strand:- start:1214 stop:1915 length:702 start_codon:yes stop_codon:yes gene_type:complete
MQRNSCGLVLFIILLFSTGCSITSDGWNAQGVQAFQNGDHRGAVQKFQYALNADSTNSDSFYNLGRVYHEIGKKNGDDAFLLEAETLYNRCLDLSADHVDCHRGLAVLLVDTGRKQEAFALLNNWAKDRPSMSQPRVELARLYEEQGDLQTARLHLESAVKLNANNARAHTALAALSERQGDVRTAYAAYQKSLMVNPNQPNVGKRLALVRQSLGESAGNTRIADESVSRGRY